jgi:Ca2+-transporting ATPase
MARQNAIINRMSIIETLGETTVICSDKTGTITKGEMTVRKIYQDGKYYDIGGVSYDAPGTISQNGQQLDLKNSTLFPLLHCGVVCNDSTLKRLETGNAFKVIGSATEGALLVLGAKFNNFKEDLTSRRIEEMPFDSKRKMMSVLLEENGKKVVYAKGAPEMILARCSTGLINGQRVSLGEQEKTNLSKAQAELTSQGYRTLALAYKENHGDTYTEDEFIFLGLVGMEDPPREEVADAIAQCKKSGIQVKMITGDNKDTAKAIASQIGIIGEAITGTEMNKLSDEELTQVVKTITIFSRVQPEDKLRIIKALKANNEIVTMTGDGVNDAPALKEANIGVALGLYGNDVSS